MSVWDDFISALTTENKLLEELVTLSTAKQERINDAPEVARLANEEEVLLGRLEEVDHLRASLFDVMAGGKTLEEWLATLDQDQQAEVGPLVLELAQNLGTLQSLNDLNQELLTQSLSYVQFSLNLLMGDESAPTYARPGGSAPGRSIFDRKV